MEQIQLTQQQFNYAYRIALRYVRNHDDAQDIAQNALLLAHRKRDTFRGDCKFNSWFYKIAQRSALMWLRKHKRHKSQLPLDEQLVAEPASFQRQLIARSRLKRLQRQMEYLTAKQKETFRLRYILGYSDRETAELLCEPKSTIKTRAFRSRHLLAA